MALNVPDAGETAMLKLILNDATQGDVKIHLYSDDVTPGEADAVASYTLVTDPAAKTLTGASWDTTSTAGTASYAQQTYTYSGAGTSYGYVVTDNAGTGILFSERFSDGPYTIPSGGGTIKVTPTISLS
ncbi:hypothetical protein DRQ25_08905 [Candidatus Fermentibacteria bacterium]|nr:MAG: hypothetical protein DRQ25_08905 [Candidatus Fermentibacteria bacterium]